MGVQLPTFADLPSVVPQAVPLQPNFPPDEVAQGEASLGTGVLKAGLAGETVGAYARIAQVRVNSALAQADLDGNLVRAKEAIATENDPEKVDLPPEEWTPGYADFASACSGVM